MSCWNLKQKKQGQKSQKQGQKNQKQGQKNQGTLKQLWGFPLALLPFPGPWTFFWLFPSFPANP